MYLAPINAAVRRAEKLTLGDDVTVHMHLDTSAVYGRDVTEWDDELPRRRSGWVVAGALLAVGLLLAASIIR